MTKCRSRNTLHALLQVGLQVVERRGSRRVRGHDVAAQSLAEALVRHADDSRGPDAGVFQQQVLDLPDADVHPTADHDVLGSAGDPRRPADPCRAGPSPITELTSFLCRRIAPHKMPVYWAFRDELPLTPSGKIQKFVLREDLVKGLLTFDETRPGELTAHEPPVR
jgi:acyl-CoA synthetase (AMP-forming)/AMP-acid ligase II